MRKQLLALALCAASTAATAAPFCVVTSYGKQCYYYDASSCRDAARQAQGMCVINEDEARPPSGGAPFCVVTSYGTQCWYYNTDDCYRAASQSRGACVPNPDR